VYKYCKHKVISTIRQANDTIAKSFRTYLKNTHAKHDTKELQKQPHWALRVTLNSTNIRVQNLYHGK